MLQRSFLILILIQPTKLKCTTTTLRHEQVILNFLKYLFVCEPPKCCFVLELCISVSVIFVFSEETMKWCCSVISYVNLCYLYFSLDVYFKILLKYCQTCLLRGLRLDLFQ